MKAMLINPENRSIEAIDINGRFQIDNIIPAPGKAVIVGTTDARATQRDATTGIDDLRACIKCL